jgi:hypothetical protein
MNTVYVKDGHVVNISAKYVYRTTAHKMWKWGSCFIGEKYYASSKPLNIKKIPTKMKKKEYTIYRFIELESAPEHYLIKNGYKKLI